MIYSLEHKTYLTGIMSPPAPKEEQSRTVTPTAGGFTVTPDSGKVLSHVVVNGDNDLIPSNIREDVNIFGVIGTLKSGEILYKASTEELVITGIDITLEE